MNVVEGLYHDKLQRGDNPTIRSRKALLLTIFYITHQNICHEISDRFNITEFTALYESEYIINI